MIFSLPLNFQLRDLSFGWFSVVRKLSLYSFHIFQGQGFQNDFKAALDKVDQEYLNELIKTTDGVVQSNDVSVKDDGTTLEDIEVSSLNYLALSFSIIYCYLKFEA